MWGADPFIGAWKLNVEKSKFDPGPPPRSGTVTYEPQGEGLKLTLDAIDAEGKRQSYQYTAYFDGKDYPVIGSPVNDTVALRRIDPYTIEFISKKDGRVVRAAKAVLLSGALSYRYIAKGKLKGQPFEIIAVYEKQ
ncbi:MAG: hypothetical protein AUI36_23280 [Cyanobacteria bacterium 13_1_40CM_2_61_4]|nr:MAG: hypothetical protein AUI36_23280 [Cyanobacteria bacterium 13_1_40CM_2_61_4]